MAWNDRPYQSDEQANRGWGPRGGGGYRDSYGRGGGGGSLGSMFGNGFTRRSVVFWLIIINIAILFLDGILTRALGGFLLTVNGQPALQLGVLETFGYFSFDTTIAGFQVWRVITFQFLHAGIGHIFFNLLTLFFFGPMVERWFGSQRFLAFYLLCGIGGTVGYLVLWASGLLVTASYVPLIGASAGIFGILMAAVLIAPNTQVMLFFVIPIPLKVLIWGIMLLAVYVVLVQGGMPGTNAGGEAAHLGGAAFGFLLYKFPRFINWADRLRAGDFRGKLDDYRAERSKQREIATEAEVNRVLDKVLEQGLASLSAREKRILQQDTDRKRNAG